MPFEGEGRAVEAAAAAERTLRVCKRQAPWHGILKCASAYVGQSCQPALCCSIYRTRDLQGLPDMFVIYDISQRRCNWSSQTKLKAMKPTECWLNMPPGGGRDVQHMPYMARKFPQSIRSTQVLILVVKPLQRGGVSRVCMLTWCCGTTPGRTLIH